MKIAPELISLIKKSNDFLIASHLNPDGDALGASIALAIALKRMGKAVQVINRDTVPADLKFLPSSGLLTQQVTDKEFDVLFIVDCNTIERTGLKDLKAKSVIIIDHHILPDNVQEIWDSETMLHSMVETKAAATGELIFMILTELGVAIDKDIATNLYTTLLFDTGGFRYSNTTPEALHIASRLVAAGAEPWWISRELYESVPYNAMQLLASAYATIEKEGGIAWITVTQEMLKETGTTSEDTENFVDQPRKIKGVEVAVFFREDTKDLIKVSLRSKGRVDVQKIVARFGGGGHAPAAGCSIKAPLHEVKGTILNAVREALKNEPRS
ncbi:MAG: bifunctional oligoribonuclease/PAP phosphatase NrnA [Nitrospirae bacterium]|nr:bifunctional oligoribonuclease/PAP phosphatase NrnA [Nitrospirota bacterium]